MELKLGDSMVDKITGFKGVAIGYTKFLNGCERFALEPTERAKDGKLIDAEWFDIGRLKHGKGENFLEANPAPAGAAPGGPPSRIREPRARG